MTYITIFLVFTVAYILLYKKNPKYRYKHVYYSPQKVKAYIVLFINYNDHYFLISKTLTTMELPVNNFANILLSLVDSDTNEPITSAVFSNVSLSSSDSSILTCDIDMDGDGKPDAVGIAEGTAVISMSASVTYTDKNTGQSITTTVTSALTVNVTASTPPPPPPPTPQNVAVVMSLGTATPVPSASSVSAASTDPRLASNQG